MKTKKEDRTFKVEKKVIVSWIFKCWRCGSKFHWWTKLFRDARKTAQDSGWTKEKERGWICGHCAATLPGMNDAKAQGSLQKNMD